MEFANRDDWGLSSGHHQKAVEEYLNFYGAEIIASTVGNSIECPDYQIWLESYIASESNYNTIVNFELVIRNKVDALLGKCNPVATGDELSRKKLRVEYKYSTECINYFEKNYPTVCNKLNSFKKENTKKYLEGLVVGCYVLPIIKQEIDKLKAK